MASDANPAALGENRVWTIPNALSITRLVGVPVFLWLVLEGRDWWALGVLAFAGVSDWLDGKIARAFNQTSRLGRVLDPAADRLYIFAAVFGLVVRDIIPLWLALVLLARDVLIVLALPLLRHFGYGTLPVNFAGKAATLCLLYAFPLLFIGAHPGVAGNVAQIAGWAFAIWGTALYWWAGVLYAVHAWRLLAADRRTSGPDEHEGPLRPGGARSPGTDGPASP
ncbi:CDP-alcohol phosphatidyltransferase family protein [Allonocardiopsis opalescens]|uniref:CDP-diacylglycerol-phosphatidylglycerol phosphatidyltransferase n=1 Tax=Allonocardiopsis opalescens TaxID=1144618 RepID=A0A2T0Q4K5_9ACTN|nr:CDP-alcohol phosphatidyltransferase family protein [Allonocardiopsis opalescens]PRX98747.1 CDP-diacylglycerol-phosphatidylglycerol phosphatidyltransferase [Allonocardiopsis opalescens]